MASATNYTVNTFLIDKMFRGGSTAIPTTMYFALFVASKGYWTATTAYSVGDTVLPATPNGHIYKCTTAGTSGSSAPGTWNTGAGSTTTDGTVVWTEMTTLILAGSLPQEASYTGYARVSVASSTSNWNATQGGTGTSNGTTGQTSNIGTVTFGAPTGNQPGVVAGMFLADASSAGDVLYWAMLTNPKTINNGDAAPNFPAGAFTFTYS
jgi:hypothetical protein